MEVKQGASQTVFKPQLLTTTCSKSERRQYTEPAMGQVLFKALRRAVHFVFTTLWGEHVNHHQPHFPMRTEAPLPPWTPCLCAPPHPPAPADDPGFILAPSGVHSHCSFHRRGNCFCVKLPFRARDPYIYCDGQGGSSAKYKMRPMTRNCRCLCGSTVASATVIARFLPRRRYLKLTRDLSVALDLQSWHG